MPIMTKNGLLITNGQQTDREMRLSGTMPNFYGRDLNNEPGLRGKDILLLESMPAIEVSG